jgi:hypothetical protein
MNIQPKDTSKGHFYVSLVKSILRIGAGTSLAMIGYTPELAAGWFKISGGLFILAESLGILEEIV